MSSLSVVEKLYFERILDMNGGYVLDYTDATFDEFFKHHEIDIYSSRYEVHGHSKARRMRAFWELESDQIVASVLDDMLALYAAQCDIYGRDVEKSTFEKSKGIVARLRGDPRRSENVDSDDTFLTQEFKVQNLHNLPIEPKVAEIIEKRLEEARLGLKAGAHLSVILMCGSVLEGVLLGVAKNEPEEFNRASTSAKSADGKVKPLCDWSLAQLIDTACEIGLLKLDVKKFSHSLRDFRNFIHPNQQLKSGFNPDAYTSKFCLQVLETALANLAKER